MITVTAIPTKMPRKGFEKRVNKLTNALFCFNGATEELMTCIQKSKTAKPSMMSPTCLLVDLLPNIRRAMPMGATMAVSVAVEKSCIKPLYRFRDRKGKVSIL